jgi:hypothetical protein
MRLAVSFPLAVGLVCLSITLTAATGQADEPAKLTVAEKAPPKELADDVRSVLEPDVVQLSGGKQPFFEFWFRKEIPLAKEPGADTFAMSAVKEGTLLGVLKVYEERYDFKDDEIPPGLYVMRFGLQPEDGDHLGTSPTPTFALLVPAKNDRELEAFGDHDELVDASSTINAAEHPSSLNLQRVADADGEFPRLASHQDGDHQVVYLRLPAKVKGRNEPTMVTFALVYEGFGDI